MNTPLSLWAGYHFEVVPEFLTEEIWRNLRAVPAVYIMTIPTASGHWFPLYIGKAKNVRRRIRYHNRHVDAWTYEQPMTHPVLLHVRGIEDPTDRHLFEAMLIQSYRPPLNERGRPTGYGLEPKLGPTIVDERTFKPRVPADYRVTC